MSNRKEDIYKVSAVLFRKKGYNATTMRDIAEGVGIKAASIYNHFPSKQDILQQILDRMADMFIVKQEEILQEEDILLQLSLLIDLHVDMTITYTDEVSLIAREWAHLDEPYKANYVEKRDLYERRFKAIIEKGKSEGILCDIETDLCLYTMLSSLRWLYSWFRKNRTFGGDRLKKEIKKTLLEGVVAGK